MPGDEAGKAGTMIVNIPKVFCIIPVRNRKEITKRCLEYLDDQEYPALHIIIVDDGSTDGTGEYLAQCMRPNLTVLKGDGNLWWGGAMHRGMKFVSGLANDRDYILMLNDDVRIEKNYVSILVNESMKNVGSVVGSVNRDESTGYINDCGYRIDYWGMRILLLHGIAGEIVDAISGRGVLLPYAAVRSVGIIRSKTFPHYLADLDYTYRIRESGWNLIVTEKLRSSFLPRARTRRFVNKDGSHDIFLVVRKITSHTDCFFLVCTVLGCFGSLRCHVIW